MPPSLGSTSPWQDLAPCRAAKTSPGPRLWRVYSPSTLRALHSPNHVHSHRVYGSPQPAEASPEQRSYRPRAQSCQGQEDFLKGFLGELKGLGLSEPCCFAGLSRLAVDQGSGHRCGQLTVKYMALGFFLREMTEQVPCQYLGLSCRF